MGALVLQTIVRQPGHGWPHSAHLVPNYTGMSKVEARVAQAGLPAAG